MKNNSSNSILLNKIIVVPVYILENLETLYKLNNVLEKILSSIEVSIVLYFNWSQKIFDEQQYKRKTKIFRKENIIKLKKVYKNKPTIGTVVHDMMEYIVLNTNEDRYYTTKIIRMDADTYDIENWYIKAMFDSISIEKSFVTWKSKHFNRVLTRKFLVWSFTQTLLLHNSFYKVRSCWCSTWFILHDYISVGWYDKKLSTYEDTDLWKKLENYKWIDWTLINKRIYTCPRRLIQFLSQMNSYALLDQRDKWFEPINVPLDELSSYAHEKYNLIEAILAKVISWDKINNKNHLVLENFVHNLVIHTLWNIINNSNNNYTVEHIVKVLNARLDNSIFKWLWLIYTTEQIHLLFKRTSSHRWLLWRIRVQFNHKY